jgi:hypothetical protein
MCVLLIALWIRSFHSCDLITKRDSSNLTTTLGSERGTMYLSRSVPTNWGGKSAGRKLTPHGWKHSVIEPVDSPKPFLFHLTPSNETIHFPYWLPVTVSALAAIVPWSPWRFSLRTLLIATTLVLAVWAGGK